MNENKLFNPLKITVVHKNQIQLENVFTTYPIIIGRSQKCDVPLSQFEFLSRQHCVINVENGKIQIQDLESVNGLFLKGQKIKKVFIENNLTLTIGEIELHFEVLADIQAHSSVEFTKTSSPKNVPKEIPSFSPSPAKLVTQQQPHSQKILNSKNSTSQSKTEKTQTVKTEKHFTSETKTSARETVKAAFPSECPVVVENKIPNPHAIFSKKDASQDHKKKPAPRVKNSSSESGGLALVKPHHHASQLRPNQRVLESYITWKDQIYESHQFHGGSQLIVGQGPTVNIPVSTLKYALPLAFYDGSTTQCMIPQNLNFSIQSNTGFFEKEELLKAGQISSKNNIISFKMNSDDVVKVNLSSDMALHLRYAPAPRQLSKKLQFLEDPQLKKTTLASSVAHFALLLTILFTEPKSKAPVIKNVPERYARLLIKKPEPKPLPPPPKKPEPPKKQEVAKKEPPKKQPPKPQPKIAVKKQPKILKTVRIQPSKILKRVNKYPVEVDRPMKVAEKPVVANIQAVGALAALTAFSSKTPMSDQPVAININKNAGGQTALNTGGVIGALKTNTGKLAAGGLASVKTKGLGYGTGTAYGVQGIQGTAGGRAIAGTVVGAPSLVRLSKEDGLSRQQVMEVVKRYMTEIQQCYERSLIDNPNISGRAEYEWEISSKGKVQWAKVKKSEMSSADSLNNCVTGVFQKMKFPVAKNGQNTIPNIGFPFGRL